MQAEIIPLRRFPKHINTLSYSVPEELRKKIIPGQLITIPLRKSIIFGLVFSIENKQNTKLKKIDSIINLTPIISNKKLELIKIWSSWYGVSYTVFAKMLLPPLQKRKIKSLELLPLKNIKQKNIEKIKVTLVENIKQIQLELKNISENSLILIPEKHLISHFQKFFPTENTVIWHSDLSTKEQFTNWEKIRNNQANIIIGTRGAAFLPFQNLSKIILLFEENNQHKHWDQAPRYHLKDIIPSLANYYKASIHYLTHSLSAETYHDVYKNIIEPTNKYIFWGKKNKSSSYLPCNIRKTNIINMQHQRQAGHKTIIADEIYDLLLKTNNSTAIYLNRKGYATSQKCKSCNYLENCPTCSNPLTYHDSIQKLICHYCAYPKKPGINCPKCYKIYTNFSGYGIEQVIQELKSKNLDKKFNIIQIDSDTETPEITNEPTIFVGTEKMISILPWKKISSFTFLNLDNELTIPEFNAQEQVWHKIRNTAFLLPKFSTLNIQTWNPQHLIFRSLKEVDRFYREDLSARKTLFYPPYSHMTRFFYGNTQKNIAYFEVEKQNKTIKNSLTLDEKSRRISSSVPMHPQFFRGNYWYTFSLYQDRDAWKKELPKINDIFPKNWKIDPRPISFLSP